MRARVGAGCNKFHKKRDIRKRILVQKVGGQVVVSELVNFICVSSWVKAKALEVNVLWAA